MPKFLLALFVLAAHPAVAATGPFFSLRNTDFVVTVAFVIFVGVLLYFRVPGILVGLLDKRAAGIRADLEQARALREEAQTILAAYERKHKEVQEQADRIVATAKREAMLAADQARKDIEVSIARRLQSAQDQIASAEAAAIRAVRDQAITIATRAAAQVIGKQLGTAEKLALIDEAIAEVDAKLH